jgi:hypothetical protein
VIEIGMAFYSSEGRVAKGLRRVVGASSVDSMLQFWFEMEGDGIKYYWMMKRRRRAHLDSMRRKHRMMWRRQTDER